MQSFFAKFCFKAIHEHVVILFVLAVFTSGGDAQGMNSALRAVVRMAIFIFSSFLFLPSV